MRTTLISLCLLISMMATADPVTKESAKERAVAFLTSKASGVAAARGEGGLRQQQNLQERLRLQEQLSSKQHYVFNIGEREGYIIVSADDCTGDLVLGYADEGSLDPDNMPENMRAWLQGYDDQIAWMKQQGIQQEAAEVAAARGEATATTRKPIAPMLTTMWNQDAPYNDRCPYVLADPNDGSTITRAAAGCLATAGAQVMYWHQKKYGQQTGRWTTTTQPIPAYEQTQQPYPIVTSWTDAQHYTTTMTVEAKAPTTIDWSKLADIYPASDEANAEVAKLIEYIGAGLQMQYGPQSAAVYSLFSPMLINYFGYNHSAQYVERRYYSYSEWTALMYDQLKNVGPVFFGGQSTGGGHAFVLDGYDEEDYFHVNWGWGGTSNGFFKLSVLYSNNQGIGGSSSSDGFNYFQSATINVNPDNTAGNPDETYRLTVNDVWTDVTTAQRASAQEGFNLTKGSPFHMEFYNLTGKKNNFDIAMGFYQGNTFLGIAEMTKNEEYDVNSGFKDRFFGFMFNASMTDGTYRMVPMCRVSGTENWYDMYDSNRFYYRITISGNTLTLEPIGRSKLNATLACSEHPTEGRPVTITATVTNNGTADYSGDLMLIEKISDESMVRCSQQVEIARGETKKFDYTYTPKVSGTANMILADGDGDSCSEETVINIESPKATTGIITFDAEKDVVLNEGDPVNGINSNKVSGTIKFTNTFDEDHNSGITFILCRVVSPDGLGTKEDQMTSYELIPKNGSKEVPFQFEGLTIGDRYFIYTCYTITQARINVTANFLVNQGIITYAADGSLTNQAPETVFTMPETAVALDITQISGVTKVVPNSNPNTLYYVSGEVPEGLTGKNVVKDGTIDALTLTDGYDFIVPKGFAAKAAPTYTRQFKPGRWSTITLPFDVTTVKVDGKTIDATRLDSETDKTMLLKEFTNEAEGSVRFDNASGLQAYAPYLIAFPALTAEKEVTFQGAANAYVSATASNNVTGNIYKFAGTTRRQNLADHYVLNNEGNAFTLTTAATVEPFRAYFKPLTGQPAKTLVIKTDESLGISEVVRNNSQAAETIYNMKGMRIGKPQKGLYIKNGKKIIVTR